jgi:integrase
MNDLIEAAPLKYNFYVLPKEVITRNGVNFDPRLVRWSYRDCTENVSLDFSKLKASEDLILSIKLVLIWYAENYSSAYTRGIFGKIQHMLSTIQLNSVNISCITSKEIINYKASLNIKNAWYLGALSTFFRKWYELGIAGVSDDAVALLKQLRIKGVVKGVAVSTMDKLMGPFTDIELEAIIDAVNSDFSLGKISLEQYSLISLFVAIGARPVQFASLKACDFESCTSMNGATIYTLKIPRAKQRNVQLSRSSFTQRVLHTQIGIKISQHVAEIQTRFLGKLTDTMQAPMFPSKNSINNEPNDYRFHRTATSLGASLTKTLNRVIVKSERTGEQIHFSAIRFRRTLGTRMAMEGHGELVIAEILDHSDTQNTGVYVQATPEIVERIDKAMALHLAPLAQAFAGVIIKNESEARRKSEPESRICDPRFEQTMRPMGSCGQHGFCGELAPISCYTCQSFQPWLDGPHEAVLNYLISERERLMVVTDSRIASINDRTIYAVAEVVRRCDEIKSEMGEA